MKIRNTFRPYSPESALCYTRTSFSSDFAGTTGTSSGWEETFYTETDGKTSSVTGATGLAYTYFGGTGGTNQPTGRTYSAELGYTFESGFDTVKESSFESRFETWSYYLSGTKYTTSSSFTTSTWSTTNSYPVTGYGISTSEISTTSRRTTTAIVDTYTTFDTVVSGSLTTSSISTTAKSNYSTYTTEDYVSGDYVWQTYSTSSSTMSDTTITHTGYSQGGFAIADDGNDWIWSVTNSTGPFGANSTLVRDCAVSIDEATVWHELQTESVDYATYGTNFDWSVDLPGEPWHTHR